MVGASMRQGPHQGAQKSTTTGIDESRTSDFQLASVNSFTLPAMIGASSNNEGRRITRTQRTREYAPGNPEHGGIIRWGKSESTLVDLWPRTGAAGVRPDGPHGLTPAGLA